MCHDLACHRLKTPKTCELSSVKSVTCLYSSSELGGAEVMCGNQMQVVLKHLVLGIAPSIPYRHVMVVRQCVHICCIHSTVVTEPAETNIK